MEAWSLPLLALVAGVFSFSSPCCLPLIPGYLSYISAIPVADLDHRQSRRRLVTSAMLFVAGFTLVFTALGVSFALVGSVLLRNVPVIVRLSGVVIVIMGLSMLGVIRVPVLARERRFDLARVHPGPRGAVFMGMAFAFGWAPCIGPVLATVLAAAAVSNTIGWGALLLVLYSIGLGLPFIALAIGFNRARGSLGWLQRHGQTIERLGGAMLVTVGVLFVSGAWRSFFLPLQRWFADTGWPPI